MPRSLVRKKNVMTWRYEKVAETECEYSDENY